jgi:hypothetical protein
MVVYACMCVHVYVCVHELATLTISDGSEVRFKEGVPAEGKYVGLVRTVYTHRI